MLRRLRKPCIFLLACLCTGSLLAELPISSHHKRMAAQAVPVWHYTLLRAIPREKDHFTEGLVFTSDRLYESTGHYGQSRVYAYNASDFTEVQRIDLPPDAFGEGLTVIDNLLYQLNWKGRTVFVYDLELKQQDRLPIPGDGWGLTTDGKALIMSDGSDTLFFRDAFTAQELRRITVSDTSGKKWQNLNELEWVNGVILANVWHLDTVLAIDPASGNVIGHYDFAQLTQLAGKQMPGRTGEQVLNGMAWHPDTQTLLVTGKDWPFWFEVALQPPPSIDKQGP